MNPISPGLPCPLLADMTEQSPIEVPFEKQPPPNSHPSLSLNLEALARSGAILLATAYAAGFVIVTLHHARFGVFQVDLLRPRVLAAGTVLLVLASLAIYIAFFTFNISFLRHASRGLSDQAEHRPLLLLIAGAWVCNSCWMVCLSPPFYGVVASQAGMSWTMVTALIIPSFMILSVMAATLVWFRRGPRFWAAANVFASAALYVTAAFYSLPSFIFGAWLSMVGLYAVGVRKVAQNREVLLGVRWDTEGMALVTILLLFYAHGIYGRISVAYGGGAPAPVVVFFVNDNPIAQSRRLQAQLIDETDKGYYFLVKQSDADRAVFVPRDQIAGIEFNVQPRSVGLPQTTLPRPTTAAVSPPQKIPAKPNSTPQTPPKPK